MKKNHRTTYIAVQDPRTKHITVVTNDVRKVPHHLIAGADTIFEGFKLVKTNYAVDITGHVTPTGYPKLNF